MRDELTDEQIEFYQENGYLVIEDFLDGAEVDRLHLNLTAAVENRGEARMANETTTGGGESLNVSQPADRKRLRDAFLKHRRSWTRVLSQHVNLWQTDEQVRKFSLDPRLGRIAAVLGDVDGVRLWHDQTMFKPAWGEPTGWHMDTPAFSFTHSSASTFWFALVDCDLSNGCMHYIPGSHKARMRTKGGMRIDSLKHLNPKWENAEPAACPVRAGAMIVHNGDTAHASCANMTPRPRPAFAISWMPCGATYNGTPNILPNEILATIKVGDPIDFDDYFPVVYSRS
ncbi:phytanoyl-CoA dioxygenase family protein [Kibdelosporangium persicum]|uniref:Phytanoyl-CoA dioxygenase n=1 Tax=Kibdelosporangium persicum TaxID=2698649 RepID=A0ABX2FDS4_9PSEU|nr:phytanoyl-CoA dioxygenase family protein [Kibdelosporangium persicum]NRN69427.1 Phytanoyl-CoA dioxygenase [Kibdelosporangium persicum]